MTCETCKFHLDGRCRRYPPQVYIRTVRDGYQNTWEEETSDWPMVTPAGWCGEYSAAQKSGVK